MKPKQFRKDFQVHHVGSTLVTNANRARPDCRPTGAADLTRLIAALCREIAVSRGVTEVATRVRSTLRS